LLVQSIMDKISPKIAAAFGVGFIGFIMAAYGYNQQCKEYESSDESSGESSGESLDGITDESLDKTSDKTLDKTSDKTSDKTLDGATDKTLEKTLDSTLIHTLEKKTPRQDSSYWVKFWKAEYKNIHDKKKMIWNK